MAAPPNTPANAANDFTCKLSGDGCVEISPLEERDYRYIALPNELKVLLVSDAATDKAAASLDVSVGSFCDPWKIPGLAHFTEHMLFMGTEKYPDEGSYRKFMSENAGKANAYTSKENTNYHFQLVVPPDDLRDEPDHVPRFKEALDRFSQFFIAPLFTESATEREMNAVDSEHQKNVQHDMLRVHAAEQELINPEHPNRKFMCGNLDTLKTGAEKAGLDTRAEMRAFHKKYYSANIMNLCIQGPHPLDVLQSWVTELFSPIENKAIEHPSKQFDSIKPRLSSNDGSMVYVEPIKDVRDFEVSWIIPSITKAYKTKPASYLSHLLGHEGKGSLLSVLKERKWVESLASGPYQDANAYSTFGCRMTLTEEGLENVDNIMDLMFGYLELVRQKGIEKWIYEEMAQQGKIAFHFQEKADPFNYVTRIAAHMEKYPPLHFFTGPTLVWKYDPQGIREVLDCFTPEKVLTVLVAKSVKDKCQLKEKWYGVSYGMEKIAKEKLARWASIQPDAALGIPPKNEFIPMDFRLLAEPMPKGERDLEGPKLIEKNEHFELHHKLDRNFSRPKVHVMLHLVSNQAYLTPRDSVLTKIFTELVIDNLTELTYDADIAGLRYTLYNTVKGIRLHVYGYNDNIDVLLKTILEHIVNFTIDADRFEQILDSNKRAWCNFDKDQPYQHAMYASCYLLEVPRWHVREYLACINDGEITIDALKAFVPTLLRRMFISSLVCGNVSEEWAKTVLNNVRDTLNYQPLPFTEHTNRRCLQVPSDRDFITRQEHPNREDNNSAVEVTFQISPAGDFKRDVVLHLLADIMNKPAFHELRTVQQLGYMVFTGYMDFTNIHHFYLIVQSTIVDPDGLRDRIMTFLAEFRKTVLAEMAEEEFRGYVDSLAQLKLQPQKNLAAQASRYWYEIGMNTFEFQRFEKELAALKEVTLQDVVDFFDEYFAEGGAQRRCMSSMVHGNQHAAPSFDETPKEDGGKSRPITEIRNPAAFRDFCAAYPVPGGSRADLSRRVKWWC